MKIAIQSIHFDADIKLLEFIQTKTKKLEQHFNQVIHAEVFLRLQRSDTEENKISEIKLHIPGAYLFAKKQCKTFKEGTDLAVESLIKQLERIKKRLGATQQTL